ncbi:hypothetical protein ACFQAV_08105 [Companilactobacillus huachuanensis]|uniref:Uncharacterized protein n=1 Tax=Companilactobacillus huachuanensis TaxID=2559914 RepID=A0ABW1RNQ1_9LACO|nr:hypothetical protein [Companilactobacillus huachuanensis]
MSKQTGISIMFGLLCLIVALALYVINLSDAYGYWQIDQAQIEYYDYSTAIKRFKAILIPFGRNQITINLNEITSASLVVGKKIQVPSNIKAAAASAYLVYLYPSSYYLGLKLKDDREVDLDLSFDEVDKSKIEQMLQLLDSKTESAVNLIEK